LFARLVRDHPNMSFDELLELFRRKMTPEVWADICRWGFKRMMSDLVAAGMVEMVGDEYQLTDKGRTVDVDDVDALIAALPSCDN